MPRTTSNPKLAMERLAEHLDVEVESSGGGRYQLPELHPGLWYSRVRALARLTWYALRDLELPPSELREAVAWAVPGPGDGKAYKGAVAELSDELGMSDARLLIRTYAESPE